MGSNINETKPQKALLGRNDVIRHADRQNRSTGATCAREKETKKERNTKERNHSSRPSMSSDRNETLRGGWSSEDSSMFRISSKSFERFRRRGSRNLPILIDLAIGIYNCLYYRASRGVTIKVLFSRNCRLNCPDLCIVCQNIRTKISSSSASSSSLSPSSRSNDHH